MINKLYLEKQIFIDSRNQTRITYTNTRHGRQKTDEPFTHDFTVSYNLNLNFKFTRNLNVEHTHSRDDSVVFTSLRPHGDLCRISREERKVEELRCSKIFVLSLRD